MTRALFAFALFLFVCGAAACGDPNNPSDGGADISAIIDQAQSNVDMVVIDQSTATAPDLTALPDLAPRACPQDFAGCTTFTDATADGAARTVKFVDYEYSPKCLKVRAGQTITFQGDFVPHPLTYACGPVDKAIPYVPNGMTASFALPAPGLYGYYCLDHGNDVGQSMSGAILVVP